MFQNAFHTNARETRYKRVENAKTVMFNAILTVDSFYSDLLSNVSLVGGQL